MKTIITINHANRKGLTHALSLIQAELYQGFEESSGTVPATQAATQPDIVHQAPAACYPPGSPAPVPVLTAQPKRREEDTPQPEELESTSYSYEVRG